MELSEKQMLIWEPDPLFDNLFKCNYFGLVYSHFAKWVSAEGFAKYFILSMLTCEREDKEKEVVSMQLAGELAPLGVVREIFQVELLQVAHL